MLHRTDPPVTTVYVDCTETLMAGLNTGIQRVVRSLVARLPAISAQLDARCVPVYARNRRLWVLDDPARLAAAGRPKAVGWARDRFVLAEAWVQDGLDRLLRNAPRARRAAGALWNLPRNALKGAVRAATRGRATRGSEPVPADLGPQDVLLLPDAYWTPEITAALDAGAAGGAFLVPVIHDIIPLTHPQFFGEPMLTDFRHTFQRLVQQAGGALAVSAATRDAVLAWVRDNAAPGFRFPVAVAHNGADVKPPATGAGADVRAEIAALSGQPFYAMVGTLEPRKGQLLVLDAFEAQWRAGETTPLVLVGRIGWRLTEIVRRIEQSPYRGTRLLLFSDATDGEVDWIYRHAAAVVLASYAEGFGLPLVEAMHHGTPVLASDIPVFHEVGGDYPEYFALNAPGALDRALARLRERLRAGQRPAARHWPTWDEAAPVFIRQALALRDQVRGTAR